MKHLPQPMERLGEYSTRRNAIRARKSCEVTKPAVMIRLQEDFSVKEYLGYTNVLNTKKV